MATGWKRAAEVRFVSPSGSQFVDASFMQDPTSGTRFDGIYSKPIAFSSFAEAGVWKAQYVTLTDEAGNTVYIDGSSPQLAGASFTVANGSPDVAPPKLKSLDIGAAQANPDGSSDFVITAHLTDDASGVVAAPGLSFGIRFVSASGQIADGSNFGSPSSGNSFDGTYQVTVHLGSFSESGVWRIEYVTARDAAGNTAWLTPANSELLKSAVLVWGTAAADALDGTGDGDSMFGYDGDDTLRGLGGDDTITGGNGDDEVDGGTGDDSIVGGDGAGNDRYTGGSGFDLVIYKSATSAIKVDLNKGKASGAEIGRDKLKKVEGVLGGQGGDKIIGSKGANLIDGHTGKDNLTGGGGKDAFKFSTVLGDSNVDTIKDFNPQDDTFYLDEAVFAGLLPGQLPKSAFRIGKVAKDEDDRVIYDKAKGRLFFDSNGDDPGGAVQFAKIGKDLDISHKDFLIV